MTASDDVRARLHGLGDFYAVASTGLLLLMERGCRAELAARDIATVALPRGDGTQVSLPLQAAFDAIEADPQEFNLTYLRTLVGMMVANVADDLKGLGYTLADNEPDEFHVLRHLRNASAHGNRFDIRNQKAKAVTFGGLIIEPSLNGQGPVFFKYATPAFVFDLFAAIGGIL